MSEVERKYDFIATLTFTKKVRLAGLNEYEIKILDASIEYFCSSTNKSVYNPIQLDEYGIYYEFEVSVFHRNFRLTFEVDGIDAFALDFEEL